MSKRCKLQKEYYKEFGNYKGFGKYTDHYVNWLEDKVLAINYTHSSIQLKEKEIITFKEFEKALTKRTFENETFYETEQGLKTIEEISVIYDLYVENL
jgi:hypothetical protein